MHVKTGDTIIVIAGKDKGKSGKIVRAFPKKDQVVVEGINMVHKHERARRGKEKGQIVDHPMPIHVSNVKLASKVKKTAKKGAPRVKQEK